MERKKKWKKKSDGDKRNRKSESLMKITEIVKVEWWIVNVEQNNSKRLSQKKTLKNLTKPRKKLQSKSFSWDFGYGISWNLRIWQQFVESLKRDKNDEEGRKVLQVGLCGVSSKIVGQKIGRKIHDDDGWYEFLPRGIFKRHKLQDDGKYSRMMTQTAGRG